MLTRLLLLGSVGTQAGHEDPTTVMAHNVPLR